jgi:hypothetical protein
MHKKGCGAAGFNEVRHGLFTTGNKSLENIPPTEAALSYHVKQALLQTNFYWSQALFSVHHKLFMVMSRETMNMTMTTMMIIIMMTK